jgi:hypothetical protein
MVLQTEVLTSHRKEYPRVAADSACLQVQALALARVGPTAGFANIAGLHLPAWLASEITLVLRPCPIGFLPPLVRLPSAVVISGLLPSTAVRRRGPPRSSQVSPRVPIATLSMVPSQAVVVRALR